MRVFTLAISVLLALVTIGCQSASQPAAETAASPQRALVVSSNSGPTTVFVPSSDPANPVVYCSAGTEVCPECKAAAVKYFTTGVLDPKCSRTGAVRTATSLSAPSHAIN